MTDKFLARGYLERAGSAADYIGSEIATAHVAGVVACLAQAMSGSSPERLIDALKGRSLRPMPELGYA